jgi:molecular chaperone DnaK (HSP70)
MTAIAIDFGTSNTVVSLLEPDTQTPKTLRFPSLSRLFKLTTPSGDVQDVPVVPTLVFVKDAETLLLGEQVRSQRLGLAQPERLFKAFKRDLVADFQPPARQLDGQSYSAESVSEQFLQVIWQQLQQQQIQPTQAIFTVPIGAFERYLGWFRDLAMRLDIPNVQLVDEATAAALGYAVERPGALVLVLDFGGGTLDLSLVRTTIAPTQGITDAMPVRCAEVLAKSDAYLGGEDIDLWIVEDYLHQIGSSRSAVGAVGWQNLLELAERLKIRLSSVESAKESWLDEETFMSYDMELNHDRFESILEARQLLEQVRQALDAVLAIAIGKGIRKADIEQVLLVGGSCLIPAVQQLVLSYFGRQRVRLDQPFEAIAHGALVVSQLTSIDDYLHHTYALRLWEPAAGTHTYVPLFKQGSRYPCQRSEPLTLQVASHGQTEIRLDIGEVATIAQSEMTYDALGRMTSTPLLQRETYRSLEGQHGAVCLARLDPPGEVGVDRVSIQFAVNEQRSLVATVQDLLTNSVLVERVAIAKLR